MKWNEMIQISKWILVYSPASSGWLSSGLGLATFSSASVLPSIRSRPEKAFASKVGFSSACGSHGMGLVGICWNGNMCKPQVFRSSFRNAQELVVSYTHMLFDRVIPSSLYTRYLDREWLMYIKDFTLQWPAFWVDLCVSSCVLSSFLWPRSLTTT